MPAARSIDVREIDAPQTWELRRRVLRDGDLLADVDFPEDAVAGAFHLGARIGEGGIVGVASFSPNPTPFRPGRRAFQLRGMAVDASAQGTGVGRALLDEAVVALRRRGAEVLWANGRDSALGFYETWGMEVVGEGFVNARGIPHHVVVFDL